jgi:hypothetical protein
MTWNTASLVVTPSHRFLFCRRLIVYRFGREYYHLERETGGSTRSVTQGAVTKLSECESRPGEQSSAGNQNQTKSG